VPKRKIVFIIGLFLLVILVGGIFLWFSKRETKGSSNDYMIKETNEGVFVENRRAGFTVKAPTGWKTQRYEFFEGSVGFDSPNVEGKLQNGVMKAPFTKGCAIETAVVYKKMSFDDLKKEIKEIHYGLGIKTDETEIVKINGKEALKNTYDSKYIGPGIAVYIPYKNNLYSFDIYWGPEEKEKCLETFNDFLNSVEFTN